MPHHKIVRFRSPLKNHWNLKMIENSSTRQIKLLNAIKNSWLNSGNNEAEDRGKYLAKILDENAEERAKYLAKIAMEKWKSYKRSDQPKEVKGKYLAKIVMEKWKSYLRCDAPKEVKPLLQKELKRNQTNQELYRTLIDVVDELSWKHASDLSESFFQMLGGKDNFRNAIIVGRKDLGSVIEAEDFEIGIIYLASGVAYPPHAHEAIELYHSILGTALWGPSMRHLKPVHPDTLVFHPSAMPHSFKVPITSDPLVAIYCWTGNVCGCYWFTELRGTTAKRKYSEALYSVNIDQKIENIETFYDDMAVDYEEVIRKWGYNMNETIVDTLVKYAGLSKNESFELLDLGCGPGICGMTLKNQGFTNGKITGIDISSKMLLKASKNNSYKSLHKADIKKKLPMSDNFYDYLICIGTTTYLDPLVILEWLRVVKKGGYIAFTLKSTFWYQWEALQQNLQNDQKWTHIWTSSDLFHQPSCSVEDESMRVRVYVYQKCHFSTEIKRFEDQYCNTSSINNCATTQTFCGQNKQEETNFGCNEI